MLIFSSRGLRPHTKAKNGNSEFTKATRTLILARAWCEEGRHSLRLGGDAGGVAGCGGGGMAEGWPGSPYSCVVV